MVKSNVVTITVTYPSEVRVNQLSVDKTKGHVDEAFHFTDHVEGYLEDSSWYVWIRVYVNDRYVKDITIYPPPGDFSEDVTFDLSFSTPGTYEVYTIAEVQQWAERYGAGVKSNIVGVSVYGAPEFKPWEYMLAGIPILIIGGVICCNEARKMIR